jgi:DNA-3-methyladenine glycosylase I
MRLFCSLRQELLSNSWMVQSRPLCAPGKDSNKNGVPAIRENFMIYPYRALRPPQVDLQEAIMFYCDYIETIRNEERKALHKNYHDRHYGFPVHGDDELFGRLILEINQAGLRWETILKREQGFRKVYENFNIRKVAAYTAIDKDRLMTDESIIRNRLKIDAIVENAKTILALQEKFGSFEKWLEHHHPRTKEKWRSLFKKTFRFTGGEIVNEFLTSIGYLPGAHSETCPVHERILKLEPMWMKPGTQSADAAR